MQLLHRYKLCFHIIVKGIRRVFIKSFGLNNVVYEVGSQGYIMHGCTKHGMRVTGWKLKKNFANYQLASKNKKKMCLLVPVATTIQVFASYGNI